MRNLRQYIVGGLVGAALTVSATAFGDEISLIGKTVQGENNVIVDTYELPQKAIAIDGTTYAPVRAIGEAAGYEVSFEDKEVILTKKEEEPVDTTTPEPSQEPTQPAEPTTKPAATPDPNVLYTIDDINRNIGVAESQMAKWQKLIDTAAEKGISDEDPEVKIYKNSVRLLQEEIEEWNQKKAVLEAAQSGQ